MFETRAELLMHLNNKILEFSNECSIDTPSRVENLARNPKTPARILHELLKTGDPLILDELAMNPAAPNNILEAFSKTNSISLRENTFKNPVTPIEIIERHIANKKDIVSNIIKSSSLDYFPSGTEDYLDYLALLKKGLNSLELNSLLSYVRSEIPVGFKKVDSDILLGLILKSKELLDEMLDGIVQDELYVLPLRLMRKFYLGIALSENEEIELFETNDVHLLFDLADNARTSLRTLRTIVQSLESNPNFEVGDSESLILCVCENQNTTGDLLEEIATLTQDYEIHEFIAGSSKITNSFLMNQLKNSQLKPDIRQLYLRNLNIELKTLIQESNNPATWYDLLLNPNVSFDLIEKMAKSQDVEVCESISAFWNINPEVLLFMLTTNLTKGNSPLISTSWEQAIFTLRFLGFDVSSFEISQLERFVPGINPKVLLPFSWET